MPKFFLVTGFLGAGKTTFLKRFIPSLAPMRMHIIVNEYGKESIDGPLLETLNTTLKQINNGSIFCTCKINDFEDAMMHAISDEPDCIVVEASGLADPTAIRSIMDSPKFRDKIDYGGAICMVDAVRFEKVYSTAKCTKKQIAASDIVLLNKADKATNNKLMEVEHIIRTHKPEMPIYRTTFGDFNMEWIDGLDTSITIDNVEEYDIHAPDISLQRFLVKVDPTTTRRQLQYFLKTILDDTYRVKGFVKVENQMHLVNCVGPMLNVDPYDKSKETNVGTLVVLSGEGLPIRKSLKRGFEQYKGLFSLTK